MDLILEDSIRVHYYLLVLQLFWQSYFPGGSPSSFNCQSDDYCVGICCTSRRESLGEGNLLAFLGKYVALQDVWFTRMLCPEYKFNARVVTPGCMLKALILFRKYMIL